jgi:hypothetical protein
MKKAASLNVGDTAIYINGYDVIESKVVKEPINDGKTRPKFKIGRTDLENGDYLVNGQLVYDSAEEAKKVAIYKLKKEIQRHTDEKLLAEGMLLVLNNKLKRLSE